MRVQRPKRYNVLYFMNYINSKQVTEKKKVFHDESLLRSTQLFCKWQRKLLHSHFAVFWAVKELLPPEYGLFDLNLMFFWPCIMNSIYINHQLLCTDYYLFIKYYSPLHVSSLKCSSSGGYSCTHGALKLCTYKSPGTVIESDSTICCMCTTLSSWRWALEAQNM